MSASAALTIRGARRDEAGLVLSFIRALAAYQKLDVHADEAAIDRALFDDIPQMYCEIAEWEGKPAGFALWFVYFSTFIGSPGVYLEDLFVHPEYRGKGIGTALLAQLAKRCVERGWPHLQWSVLDWNEPSIGFYKSLGAELTETFIACRINGDALTTLAQRA